MTLLNYSTGFLVTQEQFPFLWLTTGPHYHQTRPGYPQVNTGYGNYGEPVIYRNGTTFQARLRDPQTYEKDLMTYECDCL